MRALSLLLLLSVAFAGGDDDLPIGTNPGAIESTGKAVTDKTPLKVGQILQAKWGKTWWAARIVAFDKKGRIKITYVGWHKSSDEWVTRDRLQLDPDAVKKAKKRKPPVLIPVPIQFGPKPRPKPRLWPPLPPKPQKFWNPGPVESSGNKVPKDAKLLVGQLLQVNHGGSWWGANVLDVKGDGTVRIRYVGWAHSWDEWVTRDRLQYDTNPPSISDRPPR